MRIGWMVLALALPALSGCFGDSIEGPCAPSPHPLFTYTSDGNMPDEFPRPVRLTILHADGRLWQIDSFTDQEVGPWNTSTLSTDGRLDVDLDALCATLASIDRHPKAGEDRQPGLHPDLPSYRSERDVVAVAVHRADADRLAAFEAAIAASFFDLPKDATVYEPECADGGWISMRAHLNGTTHTSRASCQWTAEFDAFRQTARTFINDVAL